MDRYINILFSIMLVLFLALSFIAIYVIAVASAPLLAKIFGILSVSIVTISLFTVYFATKD